MTTTQVAKANSYGEWHPHSHYTESTGYISYPWFHRHTPLQKAGRKWAVRTFIPTEQKSAPHVTIKRFPRPQKMVRLFDQLKSCDLTPKGLNAILPAAFQFKNPIGVELEGFAKNAYEIALPYTARAVGDGSIRARGETDAAEIKSIFRREELEPRLKDLLTAIRSFACNSTCGLHVHFDFRGEEEAKVMAIAKISDKWLTALHMLVPVSRRENYYCRSGFSKTDRYKQVNFVAFKKYGTLEFRLHSGSFSYQKITAWIRLCELILGQKRVPKKGLGTLETLELLPITKADRAYWNARYVLLNPDPSHPELSQTSTIAEL